MESRDWMEISMENMGYEHIWNRRIVAVML